MGVRFPSQATPVGNLVVLGLNHCKVNDKDIISRALYIYVLYRAVCTLSHQGADRVEEVLDMLGQFAKQGLDKDVLQEDADIEEEDDI